MTGRLTLGAPPSTIIIFRRCAMSSRNPIKWPDYHWETFVIAILLFIVLMITLSF